MIQTNHLDCQSKASGAIRCLTMSAFTRVDFEKAGSIPHLVVLLSSGNQVLSVASLLQPASTAPALLSCSLPFLDSCEHTASCRARRHPGEAGNVLHMPGHH